jgi:hypothetical protein
MISRAEMSIQQNDVGPILGEIPHAHLSQHNEAEVLL